MTRAAALLVSATLALGCSDDFGPAGNVETGGPAQNGLLEAHNRVRETARPMPSPALNALTWSDELARGAARWASRCVWEHDRDNADGENLYATSAVGVETGETVVRSWASEAADYRYSDNSCSGVCGHYTQIVWRDTREVGCAVATCEGGLDGFPRGREFWVCRYAPAGNYVGRRPY